MKEVTDLNIGDCIMLQKRHGLHNYYADTLCCRVNNVSQPRGSEVEYTLNIPYKLGSDKHSEDSEWIYTQSEINQHFIRTITEDQFKQYKNVNCTPSISGIELMQSWSP